MMMLMILLLFLLISKGLIIFVVFAIGVIKKLLFTAHLVVLIWLLV